MLFMMVYVLITVSFTAEEWLIKPTVKFRSSTSSLYSGNLREEFYMFLSFTLYHSLFLFEFRKSFEDITHAFPKADITV